MRTILILLFICGLHAAIAQSNLTANIIEGGKTLVELVRVFKTPKFSNAQASNSNLTPIDSCYGKGLADICYKNTSGKTQQIYLYKRSGNNYATTPITIKIGDNSQECLYEIQAGIYKIKIEYEEDEKKIIYREGDIKILACDKLFKEIKKD